MLFFTLVDIGILFFDQGLMDVMCPPAGSGHFDDHWS